MNSTDGSVEHELRQTRLSRFGRMLALVTLVYVALTFSASLWLNRPSFNRSSAPLVVATLAFGALWLLLRGAPRSPRFVRVVELSTLFVGTAAISAVALVMDLLAQPDMIVRTLLIYVLLVYAVYVPSTARHTLLVASLMTLPLLVCIFVAFSSYDPALHDPPGAYWPKGQVGDVAYPATFFNSVWWAIAVAMAGAFSQTIYGLRKAVSDVRRLGQYTLEQKLGEGGMGVVYRASHAMLRRPTAIKLLLPERAGKDALARFEREVQRTAMLTHPNTVTVFDYGRSTDGVFYYAMELLEGAALDEIVEVDGPQPAARVIHLLEQAAASLAEAHDAGLIHRDVKPGNILVVDRGGISDLVKVVDFGLVKDLGASARGGATSEPALTMAGAITGTPLYIAPETVLAPERVDARADLYALGAVGYWLLTGTHVFNGKSIVEVCAHHLHSVPDAPSTRLDAAVAPDLEAVLLDCLAKRPEDRPASAHVLRERLRGCAEAGGWTNARAARWWAVHRHELRSGGAGVRIEQAGVETAAHHLRLTRVASGMMIILAACQAKPAAVELAPPSSNPELALATRQPGSTQPPAPPSPVPVASRVERDTPASTLGFASVRPGARVPWAQAVQARPEPAPTQWRLERTIRVGVGYLYRALPTPDNLGVVTLSTRDGGLRHYERKSGKLALRLDLPDYEEFEDADFAIVGERPLRVLVQRESGVVLYDLEGSGPPRTVALPAGNLVRATSLHALYGFADRDVPSQTGSLSLLWLAEDGTSTAAFDLLMSERPDAWALSTDGRLLAINYYPSNLTQLLDLERSSLVASIESPQWGGSVACSPGGNYLAMGGAHLALHAAADGRLLATDKTFGNNIADVRFTPQGELLLVSAYDGKVRSYALPPGDALPERLPRPQLLRHAGAANVYGLGLSRDGRLLVTPSGDETLELWVR